MSFTTASGRSSAELQSLTASHVTIEMGDDMAPASQQQAGGTERPAGAGLRRFGSNLATAAARTSITVGIPTALREAARRTFLQQLATTAPRVAAGGAVMAGAVLPVAQHLIAIVREARNQTLTNTGLLSHVAGIGLSTVPVAALALTGGTAALAGAAPSMIAANLIYTTGRDLLNYHLQLTDNSRSTPEQPATPQATAIGATAYAGNQTAVGISMDALGGAAAQAFQRGIPGANVAGSWAQGFANGLGQALARMLLNVAGETLDEVVMRYAQANTAETTDGEPLQLQVRRRPDDQRTPAARLDAVLNSNAFRNSLFSAAISVANLVGRAGGSDALGNLGAATTLGAGYVAFVGGQSHRPAPPEAAPQGAIPLLPTGGYVAITLEDDTDDPAAQRGASAAGTGAQFAVAGRQPSRNEAIGADAQAHLDRLHAMPEHPPRDA